MEHIGKMCCIHNSHTQQHAINCVYAFRLFIHILMPMCVIHVVNQHKYNKLHKLHA